MMEYKPSLPANNDNVSEEHPLKDVAVILGWLVVIVVAAYGLLGLAIDAIVENMDHETEAKLVQLMPAPGPPTEDAPAEQVRLQALVDSMRSCAGLRLPAAVTLVESDAPNAMVMPGGHIVVYSGLMSQVESENGLAFVLAHELSHLTNRDHLRGLGRGLVLFGISAILTGSDSGLTELLAPVHRLGEANYSRTREADADAAALRILNCRYGHAGGATEFFAAMGKEDDELTELSHYVASHPAMRARIDAINTAIRTSNMKVAPVRPL